MQFTRLLKTRREECRECRRLLRSSCSHEQWLSIGQLRRRAHLWAPAWTDASPDVIWCALPKLLRSLPQSWAKAVLFTILNGWCTSRRIKVGQTASCPFCDEERGDHLSHLLMCQPLWHAIRDNTGLHVMTIPLRLGWTAESEVFQEAAAYLACTFAVYHAARLTNPSRNSLANLAREASRKIWWVAPPAFTKRHKALWSSHVGEAARSYRGAREATVPSCIGSPPSGCTV